jgi:hypothetical protein
MEAAQLLTGTETLLPPCDVLTGVVRYGHGPCEGMGTAVAHAVLLAGTACQKRRRRQRRGKKRKKRKMKMKKMMKKQPKSR